MFENLLTLLNTIYPLSKELMSHLQSILLVKEVPRKTILLPIGQVCQHIYFVEKGILRCYYEKNGEQITSWFMKENEIIISVKSFFTQTPSKECIITLEDTVLHGIHIADLENTYMQFPEFNIIGRILTTKYYILSEERLYSIRKERA